MPLALAHELRLRALPDERLARLAANGDEAAFAAIYRRHHQGLYRYCRSILRDPEQAHDALQSAMLKALRGLSGGQPPEAPKAWLYRIAHNESITLARRHRSHEEITDAELPLAPGADRRAEERAQVRQLIEDLGELPERQRSALVMRELSGLEHEEIGTALGTSAHAAKQAVSEARRALHEHAKGRDAACDGIRVSISARDGRVTRGRKVRAHIRHCSPCREFHQVVSGRATDFNALAPPLPVAAAAALLESMVGGAGTAAAASGVALGGGLTTGQAIAGSAGGKWLIAALATAAAAAGTVGGAVEKGAVHGDSSPKARGTDQREKSLARRPDERTRADRRTATRRRALARARRPAQPRTPPPGEDHAQGGRGWRSSQGAPGGGQGPGTTRPSPEPGPTPPAGGGSASPGLGAPRLPSGGAAPALPSAPPLPTLPHVPTGPLNPPLAH